MANLWANRSKGACLFVMPKGNDWGTIKRMID